MKKVMNIKRFAIKIAVCQMENPTNLPNTPPKSLSRGKNFCLNSFKITPRLVTL